jgi:hypothetical protein
MCKFTEFDFNYESIDLSVVVDDCMSVVDDTAYDYDGVITTEGLESLVNEWFDSREELVREWGATRLSITVEGIDYQKVREIVNTFAYKVVKGCDWTYKREEYTATYLNVRNELLSDRLYSLVYWLRDERNANSILNNRLNSLTNSMDENTILNKTGLKQGVKVSKLILNYLNKIVDELDLAPDLLKEYRKEIEIISQSYSKLIELFKQCNSKHTVYLSCDIRDFLRCSYGNGWKSCHRLGGEYGSGAISYILNPNVLIAYVSSDDATLDWREIVYTDLHQRLFVGSRQYKNSNPSFMKAVQSIILNQYGNDLELFDASNTERVQKYAQEFIKYSYYDDAFAYNDIHLYGDIDAHIWILKAPDVEDTKIDIQTNQIICLQCGEYTDFIESDVCTCRHCYGYDAYVCDICGEYHDEDDIEYIEYYDENGHECEGYVCSECIINEMFFCHHCQRYHHNNNDYEVVEGVGIDCDSCIRYNLATGDYVQCDDCQRIFDAYYMSLTDVDGLTLCDDCIDNTADYCLECGKPHLVGELENGLCKDCTNALEDKLDSLIDEVMSNYEL